MLARRFAILLVGCVLAVAAIPATAANGDTAATALLRQAQALQNTRASKAIPAAQREARIERLLGEIARTRALAEHGAIRIGRARLAALEAAAAALDEGRTFQVSQAKGTSPGTITGFVRDAGTSAPLQGVLVRAAEYSTRLVPSGAGIVGSTPSAADGSYTLTVPPGKYTVRTSTFSGGTTGYPAQAYPGIPCADTSACPPYSGDVLTVATAGNVPNIDFDLVPGGAISGTVIRASDGMPVAGIQVAARMESALFGAQGFASTDAAGNYTIRGLQAGLFKVLTNSDASSGLMAEVHAGRPCSSTYGSIGNADPDCYLLPADWVTVTSGATVPAIDFSLDPLGGSIAGTVTLAGAGTPIAGAEVTLVSDDGWTWTEATTDAAGQYLFQQLRPTTYRVLARGAVYDPMTFALLGSTYVPVVHPGIVCTGVGQQGCDPIATGTPIAVAGAAVTGIDFALSPGGRLQGTVRRGDLLTAIEGAQVQVYHAGLGSVGVAYTDAAGVYTAAGLPPGVYYAYVNRIDGYAITALGNRTCNGYDLGIDACGLVGSRFTITGGETANGDIDAVRGGIVTGAIMDATVGVPAPRSIARMEVYDASANLVDIQATFIQMPGDPARYTVSGLAPGTYKGVFASSSTLGLIDTAYGGIPCPRGGCDQSVLPPIYATAGGTLSGIDGSLARGRIIRGRVTDAATGQGIPQRAFDPDYSTIPIIAFNNSLSNYAGFAQVDGRGDYFSRTGFPSGTTLYPSTAARSARLEVSFGLGYVDQNFGGVACPFSSCGATNGTAITIGMADIGGIDFPLNEGGEIAGVVSASAGGAGVQVIAYAANGKLAGRDTTDALGNYKVRGLPPGSHFVATANAIGYLNEVYPNIACEPFCNPLIGTPVTVTGTATTGGIDFALDLAASVSGTVNAENVPVEIYGAIGNLLRNTTSAANGSYAFTGLAAGTFYVRTRNTTGQADELWSGEPCVGDACNVRRGTPVVLAAGADATNRDLTLAAPGVITGQVTRQNGGAAQSGVMLQLLAASGAVALTTTTNGTGDYTFSGLAAGDYYLVTRGTPGLIDVAYPSTPCPAACNGLNGSSVAVTAGTTLPGVNIQLQDAGYISGSVKTGGTVPVVGAVVQAYNTLNVPTAQIATNASGNYQLDGLSTGQFYVRTQNSLGLVDQVFKAPVNLQCSGFCDVLSGTQVAVNAGSAIPLPDFNLAGGAIVSGRVTKASDGSGIALATVLAYDNGGNVSGVATANANGDYTIGGLRLLQSNGSPAGYYLRTANLSGFVNQLYKGSGNLSCSPTPCSNLFLGTRITVSGTPVAGINFALAAGSVISGTATDQFNNPLPTGTAVLYDSTGAQITTSAIDRGVWQFSGLANGTYYVLIQNNVGLVDQLYANVPCPGGACSITTLGTPVVLSGGAGGGSAIPKNAVASKGGVATIDLKLGTGQTIAGTVLEAGTDVPLAGVTVYFFGATGALVGQATTDGLGEYLSDGGFQPGTYYAATTNGTTRGAGENTLGLGYVNRLYAGQNCLLDCNVTAGMAINVAAAPVQGIDFTLATAGAGITGTVRDAQSQPLEQIPVEIYSADGNLAGTTLTNSQALYAIDGLPAGNYYARTRNNVGLTDGLFGGQPCVGACNPLLGSPITVPAVAAITGIDINLSLLDGIFANGFEN